MSESDDKNPKWSSDVRGSAERLSNVLIDVGMIIDRVLKVGQGEGTRSADSLEADLEKKVEAIRAKIDEAQKQSSEVFDDLKKNVEKRPWSSAITAFGIGILAGLFMRKK